MSINRRQLLSGAAASLALAQPAAAQERKPNVLIILMDDLGCHDLGFLGADDLKTPHIDGLVKAGARFTNWCSNAPVCAPARAALMTGRYPIRAGMPANGLNLPVSEKLIPAVLKPAGYRTAAFGKWHLGDTPETVPNAKGFDAFYGFHSGCVDYYSHRYYWGEPRVPNYHDLWRNREEIFEDGQYLTERLAQESAKFIRESRGEPFFVYTAFNAVHYPMHAPRKYVERFPNLAPERQMYAAMLAAADDGVGEILRAIEETGQRGNTLIFFLGDNGATTEARAGLGGKAATAGSNAPFRGFKFSLFDGGMHVPGAMSWPGVIPAGPTIDQLVMTADILPTTCGVAGVAVPQDRIIDGKDVLAVATKGAKSPHGEVYWANGGQLAVRRGFWKLVINGITYGPAEQDKKPLTGEDALFLSNLKDDPGETMNLRHKYPQLVDELFSLAQKWRREVNPQ